MIMAEMKKTRTSKVPQERKTEKIVVKRIADHIVILKGKRNLVTMSHTGISPDGVATLVIPVKLI